MSKTIFFSHLYVIIQSSFVVPTYLYLGNLLIEKKNWIYVYTTCGCFYTCFSLSGQMGLGKKIKTKTENNIKRSLQIRYGSFYLRNMRPLHLWMLCAKYGIEIVKNLQLTPTTTHADIQILIKKCPLELEKIKTNKHTYS